MIVKYSHCGPIHLYDLFYFEEDFNKYKPFFKQAFRYESNGLTRLLVMRKSDGVFVANITMSPFFVTHQVILIYTLRLKTS